MKASVLLVVAPSILIGPSSMYIENLLFFRNQMIVRVFTDVSSTDLRLYEIYTNYTHPRLFTTGHITK